MPWSRPCGVSLLHLELPHLALHVLKHNRPTVPWLRTDMPEVEPSQIGCSLSFEITASIPK